MSPHDPPLWRWFLISLAGVVALLLAGWLFLRWIDGQMTGVHVHETASGAREFAERYGLRLATGDRLVYGEVQSSFPDSGAYLVVDVPTIADRQWLMERSGLRCGPAKPSTVAGRRGLDDHGPGNAPSLQDCTGSHRFNGGLIASFDPVDRHLGTRIFIDAYEM